METRRATAEHRAERGAEHRAEHRAGRWEAVIGLEIHVQLRTRTKLFCGCANRFGEPPNTLTCPVCLGMPGALPVLNREAVRLAARAAAALGCALRPRSRFARKNYFYPDLPKGYQISQYEQPLAEGGSLDFDIDGRRRRLELVRLHLEEDAGKSVHEGLPRSADATYVDLNRCGVPLVEIVTEPQLRSPEEAHAFLTTLRTTLLALEVTDASMEQGSLRCDANVSVRRRGETTLNPKSEIKNLNSFRFVRQALAFELERQSTALEAGETLRQGTRLWDEKAGRTVPMRVKEEAHDYRYFPEPDLVPIELDEAEIGELMRELPELPLARHDRFVRDYGLQAADAAVLIEDAARADYFEALVGAGAEPLEASNWVRIRVMRELNERGWTIEEFPVDPPALAELLAAIAEGAVSASLADDVLARMIESGEPAADIIASEGLEVMAAGDLAPLVDRVLDEHPDEVEAFRSGRQQVLGFLMGQVMRASGGKADPQAARRLLTERLREERLGEGQLGEEQLDEEQLDEERPGE